ncbi:MAG: hypothetical protein AB7T22_00490 [Calditrichaceae bacterium]
MPETNNNRNIPGKKPLWEEIKHFTKKKSLLATLLIVIGLIGFVIPVIPGLLLILFAVALLKPGLMKQIREKLKKWKI